MKRPRTRRQSTGSPRKHPAASSNQPAQPIEALFEDFARNRARRLAAQKPANRPHAADGESR